METHFELELDTLRQKLLLMASWSETLVRESVQALVERNHDLAIQVKANDDVLDRAEVEIDDRAISLLTKAPLASDLRLIRATMKISTHLERVGDEATKIAKRAGELASDIPVKNDFEIPRMSSMALSMLKNALDAFVQRDPAMARAIIPLDKEVDELNRNIHQAITAHMTEHLETIPRCLKWMVAAKSLERIADHAKNIAEEVVYLCEAEDIRHSHLI